MSRLLAAAVMLSAFMLAHAEDTEVNEVKTEVHRNKDKSTVVVTDKRVENPEGANNTVVRTVKVAKSVQTLADGGTELVTQTTLLKDAPGSKDDVRTTTTQRTVRDTKGNVVAQDNAQSVPSR